MAVPVSSLSVAVQGIADFLDTQFGEEVNITVTHPQKASEISKGAGVTAHSLNLFAYRVVPSGIQADVGSDQTQFIRLYALITPFPADLTNAPDDVDLRILGHAIRVLQSHPVLPISPAFLPGPAITEPPGRKDYRLESIMLSPPMEEINHIWTTQGGDLAYRLSALYEFSLIPIEPLSPRVDAAPPDTLMIDTHAEMSASEQSFIPVSNNSTAHPLGDALAVNWLPVQMGVSGERLSNGLSITPTTTVVTLAIVGPVNETVALRVIWRLDDATQSHQSAQIKTLVATSFDDPQSRTTITLTVPVTAGSGEIRIQPAASGVPVLSSPFGNTITLSLP